MTAGNSWLARRHAAADIIPGSEWRTAMIRVPLTQAASASNAGARPAARPGRLLLGQPGGTETGAGLLNAVGQLRHDRGGQPPGQLGQVAVDHTGRSGWSWRSGGTIEQ